MAHAIRMPKPGQMTEECVLIAWHKEEGDPVRRGDVLFEIETDKASMDVEAFDDGVLLRRLVEAGATVPVNAVCAYVGDPGEAIPDDEQPSVEAAAVGPSPALPPPEPAVAAASPVPGSRVAISPRAARRAAEANLDPRAVTGTGPGGRIVERDVEAAIAALRGSAVTAAPTGPTPAPAAPASPQPPGAPGEDEPRPLTRMRRVIADRLTQSWTTTPHFTVTVAVDMSAVLALREELRDASRSYSVTDFVLAATAQTLVEFPELNAMTDGASVWRRRAVHLGLAVSVPGGLVVPVVRDADRLTLDEIHVRAQQLAAEAREGALTPDDLAGSTFTVSNLGMHGVEEFSAIINPGEAAILAVASAVRTPVAFGDGIAVRPMMKLTLSADHRLVDGETGARFLNALRRRLQDGSAFRTQILWDG